MRTTLTRAARSIPPAWRYRARGALAAASHYAPGPRPDVLLFSARRGGSTWLMELIAIEPRVKFVNEPFHPDVLRARALPTESRVAPPVEHAQGRERPAGARGRIPNAPARGPAQPPARGRSTPAARNTTGAMNGAC